MNRRFVNLVLGDYNTRMHSLFRLDVAKHLFYPSTAQAEAANAKQQETNNNGGGVADKPPTMKWPKPPRMKWLRPLPKPSMRFFRFDVDDDEQRRRRDRWPSYDDAFMLLRPNSSDGTILHATEGGRTVIFDADANAISATAPFFDTGMGRGPVVFSVPGADAGEKESLYVMRSTISSPVRDRYSCRPHRNTDDEEEDRCSGDFVVLDMNQQPYKWQHLPRPPFVVEKDPYEHDKPDFCIRSSAVIDSGRTIVVSFDKKKGHYGVVMNFTYCFETSTRQWRHAGDWALPFTGRAEYVPELKTWIGFSATSPHHLCSIDLSSAMDAGDRAPPTPQHVWDDFTPPPYTESEVVLNRSYPDYVFGISRGEKITRFHEYDSPDVELFAVLTGVEVVRCNDDGEEGGELRMVKHKSKRCPVQHPWAILNIDSDSVDEFTYCLEENKGNYGGGVKFTYCFDTSTRQWRHAGDWALPFNGRAEYVPELETWIGLSSSSPHHHLCAVDLSAAMDAGRAPTPEHVWDSFTPPPDTDSSVVLKRRYPQYLLRRSTEWWPSGWLSLVNLGSGRFCTLKVFDIRRSEWADFHEPDWPDEEAFAVITGVEVLRGNDGLRMVKHKCKRCPLTQDHWLF
ncbi:hypothetical protein HU200_001402 [Digitaria exilis]|uniref:Uncharacterized protein n=1 Tax=Digitaria exilis TaxID=1010633 RepID=A0A835FZX3_9POAL|nr:hypothetical protein HU200_001402 [Digitaria exilis]